MIAQNLNQKEDFRYYWDRCIFIISFMTQKHPSNTTFKEFKRLLKESYKDTKQVNGIRHKLGTLRFWARDLPEKEFQELETLFQKEFNEALIEDVTTIRTINRVLKNKRIKIWADIHSSGLFDELGKFYLQEETTICDETWMQLQNWVKDYDTIAVMDTPQRRNFIERITELDSIGLRLKDIIAKEWKEDINSGEELEFVYYSEGLMKEIG